jgi:MFS transporter, PPP family, 3-phenylpropionic acid transporter
MPYWRLSAFYFFYFAVLGVLVPYWGLYLRSIGFGPEAIGVLMALPMLARIPAPTAWGWLADRYGKPIVMVRIAAALTWLVFLVLLFVTDFWWVALAMFVFAFFWHAALPLLEANTMTHVGGDPGRYARVRWWGSFGFVLAAMVLGPMTEVGGPQWIPSAMLGFGLLMWLTTLALPKVGAAPSTAMVNGSARRMLLRPEVIAFFAIGMLAQVSHGPYYTFFTIYLTDHGYGETQISALWAIGVLAEIGVFLVMQPLLRRFGARVALLGSFALGSARWSLIGHFPESVAILVSAQLLHAVTFGVTHSVCIYLVHQFFVGSWQNRGQGLYGSLSFGLGGAIGALYSGITWKSLGAAVTYDIAAAAAALAFVITAVWIRPKS